MPTQIRLGALSRISPQAVFANEGIEDLRGKSLRGGAVVVAAQGLKFVLQMGSVMILARLLSPADFGLQSMVLAMTGFIGLFRDAGLSVATVQRNVISHEQTSMLFWINAGIGVLLACLTAIMAPILVGFYREPRLFWLTILSGSAFIFNGFAAQHQALLVRQLRFSTMAFIDVLTLGSGAAVGIVMAWLGFGYWSFAGMAVAGPTATAIGLWIAVPWIPTVPKRGCEIRSMLNLGGATTANMAVAYAGNNTEKFLLGRFWGAEVLGLYSRAYQLANVPLQQLSSAIFNVIFPALSRIQEDVERRSRFFLKAYSLIVSVCLPITICCALFAQDIVPLLLGPKWTASIPIFRLLAPTFLAFTLTNPFGWFLISIGRAWRGLQIALLVTPAVILAVVAGLHHGPRGVATGYSVAMILLTVPIIALSIKGTGMRACEVWRAVRAPIVSGLATAVTGIATSMIPGMGLHQIPQLALNVCLALGTYIAVLLFVMRQHHFYWDLVKQLIYRR